MDKFTVIARKKVSNLIRRDSFKEITAINDESVYLKFDDTACKIDGFGRVTWFEKINLNKGSFDD